MNRKYAVGAALLLALILMVMWPLAHRKIRRMIGGFITSGDSTRRSEEFVNTIPDLTPPNVTVPPSQGHTGRIWILPDGTQIHEGPGHTGTNAPFHYHPIDPKTGKKLPGPGIPLYPKNRGQNGGATAKQSMTPSGFPGAGPGPGWPGYPGPGSRPGLSGYPGGLPGTRPGPGFPIDNFFPGIIASHPPEGGQPGSLARPGGVRLDAQLDFLNNVGSPQAVVLDSETGSVVLVTSEGAANAGALTKGEWATLVQCAYAGRTPTFSLDPFVPAAPEGPYLSCVYSDGLANTSVGQALLDIDVLGKRLCMGAVTTVVPGWQNMFDLAFAEPSSSRRSMSRIWFTGDRIQLRRSGTALTFAGTGIQVKTERMLRTKTGMESSRGVEDPALAHITEFMTNHLPSFAAHHAEFDHLARLMRAFAVAKFMAQCNMPANQWLSHRSSEAAETPIVMPITRLTREQSKTGRRRSPSGYMVTTSTRRVTLCGGVNMAVNIPEDQHDPVAGDIDRRVMAELRRGASHRFNLPGTQMTAVGVSSADFATN